MRLQSITPRNGRASHDFIDALLQAGDRTLHPKLLRQSLVHDRTNVGLILAQIAFDRDPMRPDFHVV